ncbi:MAG: hypothetical protein Q4A15_08990, partial [Prevotellaceae bacterium]|nr:hypothetical protein [Prevotellaceae bacterium]
SQQLNKQSHPDGHSLTCGLYSRTESPTLYSPIRKGWESSLQIIIQYLSPQPEGVCRSLCVIVCPFPLLRGQRGLLVDSKT